MNFRKNLKMLGRLGVVALVLAVGVIVVAGCGLFSSRGDGSGGGDSPSTSSSDACALTTYAFKALAIAMHKYEDAADVANNVSSLSSSLCIPIVDTLMKHPWQPVDIKIGGRPTSITGNQVSQFPAQASGNPLRCPLPPSPC